LPQPTVGHLDRVRRLRDAVARHPGLAVAGAAYDGVGVPAVARSGRAAAQQALRTSRRRAGHPLVRQNGGHEQPGRRDPA
jgi:oxygen-dependent protoporphyrinogen oxidase